MFYSLKMVYQFVGKALCESLTDDRLVNTTIAQTAINLISLTRLFEKFQQ